MSISYERTGRVRQKARTREALVEAARGLLDRGEDPAVEKAADSAGVSRATAYRYFPNRRALLGAAAPVTEASSLLDADAPDDVEARLELVLEALSERIVEHEAALRAMWRLSLEAEPPAPEKLALRRGRAIGWIEDALSPLRDRLSKARIRRLAIAIRAAVGIEPLVWLTDIAGLSRKQAIELMRANARAILRETLREVERD